MEMKRCPRCGKFYNTKNSICNDCYNLEMEDSKKLESVIDFSEITYEKFNENENLVKYADLAGLNYNVAKRCSEYFKDKFLKDDLDISKQENV